jgi:hypothetical protein
MLDIRKTNGIATPKHLMKIDLAHVHIAQLIAGVLNLLFHGSLCLSGEGHGPLLRITFLNAQNKTARKPSYINKIHSTK